VHRTYSIAVHLRVDYHCSLIDLMRGILLRCEDKSPTFPRADVRFNRRAPFRVRAGVSLPCYLA
jgi:hypothetical protein